MDSRSTNGVVAVEESSNVKTGKVSVTNTHQASCPKDCPFYNNGCYAETGSIGMFVLPRLKKVSGRLDALILAKREAKAIRKLTGLRPLRLHVVGDCKTKHAAKAVSAAADEHTAKHGQPVWTYTHSWRTVPRSAWGGVSVLASCETMKDVKQAHRKNYPAAIVVKQHKSARAVSLGDGYTGIPCPEQTLGVSCTNCQLCFKGGWLHKAKRVIMFATHGVRTKLANAALDKRNGK